MKKLILFPLVLMLCAMALHAQQDNVLQKVQQKLDRAAKLQVKVHLLYKKTGGTLINMQDPSKSIVETEEHELVCDGIIYNVKGNVAFDKKCLAPIQALEKEHRPVSLIIDMVGLNADGREPINFEAGVNNGVNTKLFGNRAGKYLTFPLVARRSDFKEDLVKIFGKRVSLTDDELARLTVFAQKPQHKVTRR